MTKNMIITGFLCLLFSIAKAQENENTTQRSNILEYTPSKLLNKGDWDFKVFNNLYTQTEIADSDGNKEDVDRSNFFTTTLEVYTGVSENSRINVGLLVNIKSNTFNQNVFSVFSFENNSHDARSGVTSIAPSIKILPFKNIANFSIQSSFYIPIFEDQNALYLDKRSFVWESKFYYDYTFGSDKFQIFGELDLAYNFGEKSSEANVEENSVERFANNSLGIPVSVFFSYFPSEKFTVFVNAQHYQLVDMGNDFTQNYTLAGLGVKYQLTKELNLELSSAKFFRGKDNGLGQTFNLGLRYLLTK